MKTILLAVDASRRETLEHPDMAAQEVRELSSATGDRVVVLHVHEITYGQYGRMQVDCFNGAGEKIVEQIVAELRTAGITAEGWIRSTETGHVARAILTAASECDARIVVLGSGSRTDLPRLPFGSVSTRLLHLSRRPVLIVPWAAAPEAQATDEELMAEVSG